MKAQYIKKVAKSHDEWLKLREGGIGSSEIGTLMGVNKYQSVFQLWERKKNLVPPIEENEAMRRGHFLEDAVSQFFQFSTGKKVIQASAKEWIAISTENPIFRVSPDRLYFINGNGGKKGVLECKTTNMKIDEDNIPQSWFCQLQYQMGILGLEEGTLAWLTGNGFGFGYQTFNFDAKFFEAIKEKIVDFWTRYMEGDERPTPTTVDDLAQVFPTHMEGKTVTATEEVRTALQNLAYVKEDEKILKEKKEGLELIIKQAFGDAEMLVDLYGDTLATWKAPKASTKFNVEKFKASNPQLYASFCEPSQGARRFLVK